MNAPEWKAHTRKLAEAWETRKEAAPVGSKLWDYCHMWLCHYRSSLTRMVSE